MGDCTEPSTLDSVHAQTTTPAIISLTSPGGTASVADIGGLRIDFPSAVTTLSLDPESETRLRGWLSRGPDKAYAAIAHTEMSDPAARTRSHARIAAVATLIRQLAPNARVDLITVDDHDSQEVVITTRLLLDHQISQRPSIAEHRP
ncbi:MAG: hypothetical protein PHP86_19350 [Nevskiales bacterium]|nr:hypothetical protein [Nevskiales bacterium]